LPSNDIYMSYRTAKLQTLHFKYVLNKYPYWIISVSFSPKCRLFHNAILFGSCIIHILNTKLSNYIIIIIIITIIII
jgi:hypothetical protein